MKNFREMNHARIGLIGVVVVVATMALLFNLTQFAFLTGATTYRAEFANAGGLQSGDTVRLAGAPVGQVRDMELDGNKVVVEFDITADDIALGDSTSAAIKTETVLGRKFLQVTPGGRGELDPDTAIPLARTTVPYDLTDQLGQLASTTGEIDVDQLSESLDVLAETFQDAPNEVRSVWEGLTRFSRTLSSRDAAVRDLLSNAEGVTSVLADRNDALTRLVVDGNLLLGELERRRTAIHALLVNVTTVARELSGLVNDNRAAIAPTLRKLNSVLDVLRKNEGNIVAALQRIGPFASALGEAVASGPFFTAYIQNLLPGNLIPLPNVAGEQSQGGPR